MDDCGDQYRLMWSELVRGQTVVEIPGTEWSLHFEDEEFNNIFYNFMMSRRVHANALIEFGWFADVYIEEWGPYTVRFHYRQDSVGVGAFRELGYPLLFREYWSLKDDIDEAETNGEATYLE